MLKKRNWLCNSCSTKKRKFCNKLTDSKLLQERKTKLKRSPTSLEPWVTLSYGREAMEDTPKCIRPSQPEPRSWWTCIMVCACPSSAPTSVWTCFCTLSGRLRSSIATSQERLSTLLTVKLICLTEEEVKRASKDCERDYQTSSCSSLRRPSSIQKQRGSRKYHVSSCSKRSL